MRVDQIIAYHAAQRHCSATASDLQGLNEILLFSDLNLNR
jgi:hypothetical protein